MIEHRPEGAPGGASPGSANRESASPTAGAASEGVDHRFRILIVAAVPAAREALRWALEGEPDIAVVGEAANGEAALAVAATLAPDVVLLDIVLLDVARSGTDAIAITRALKAGSRPPLAILLATAGSAIDRQRYAQVGGDGLVERGAGWPALIKEIRLALASRQGRGD